MMELVPHSFSGISDYPRSQKSTTIPGQAQGVYITLRPDVVDDLAAKMASRFAGREEIQMIDSGTSERQQRGFGLIKWYTCEIDRLFPTILRYEAVVDDDTVSGRTVEG